MDDWTISLVATIIALTGSVLTAIGAVVEYRKRRREQYKYRRGMVFSAEYQEMHQAKNQETQIASLKKNHPSTSDSEN